jgi:hypothetical protein
MTATKEVNQYMVMALLNPLAGGADDDVEIERYSSITPDDEELYKSVIRQRLKPYFEQLSDRDRAECKTSLRYYLSKPGSPFHRFMEAELLPFPPPRDPRQFFVWMWEEFFGSEEYSVNLGDYAEVNNIGRPNMIKLRT